MKPTIPDYLKQVLENARHNESGKKAGYIDVLAKADGSKMAVALATVDGNLYSAGDDDVEFSCSLFPRPLSTRSALRTRAWIVSWTRLAWSPSGDAFNKPSLHRKTHRPINPMINAGAIATHSLVVGPHATAEQRVDRILKALSKLAGRQLHVDEAVYEAELKDADRNMGLGYMLKAAGIIECDPQEAVRGYIRQCSISANMRDLAMMSATLGNAGVHPVSGEEIIPHDSVRQALSIITTCGMYDAAGDWVSRVGIPAKSSVAGGIIGALPGQVGIAVFSPKLDERGNSVRGVMMCEQLSSDMGLHMMDIRQVGRATVRTCAMTLAGGVEQSHECEQEVPIFDLRGVVRFAGTEPPAGAIARELTRGCPEDPGSGHCADACAVIISLKDVHPLNNVAQRVIREDIRRLQLAGRRVVVIDPARKLKLDSGHAPDSRLFVW